MRLALRLAGPGVLACAVLLSNVSLAQEHTLVANDPIRAQLVTVGKSGLIVTLARDRTSEILQSTNSCSGWFHEVDPNAASTFVSIRFIIEANGPNAVLASTSHLGEIVLQHPYCARAVQKGGANSIVVINPKGAFFVRKTIVLRQENAGGSFHLAGWSDLTVGPYVGDTVAAQITILLHELGHVIGRIPDDSDESSGQSGRNTDEVLRFCRNQINAAAATPRRSINPM